MFSARGRIGAFNDRQKTELLVRQIDQWSSQRRLLEIEKPVTAPNWNRAAEDRRHFTTRARAASFSVTSFY
jgi:hypothetical protein